MPSGVYHVVIHDVSFTDDADFDRFLLALLQLQTEGGSHCCAFYAYSFMPGHIHLLLKEKDWKVPMIVDYLSVFCAADHVEYESEPIEDEERFLDVLRYIHQDPVLEGVADTPSEYAYGSWANDYLNLGSRPVCVSKVVVRRFGFDRLNEAVNTPLPENFNCLDYSSVG